MAKQARAIQIEGTIDGFCFYKLDGEYYVRTKSSLTGKRFWKSKAFERSRESCSRFGNGNKLASRLYRTVPKEKRSYQLFCFLKKRAIVLLKKGKSLIKAEEILLDYLYSFALLKSKRIETKRKFKEKAKSCLYMERIDRVFLDDCSFCSRQYDVGQHTITPRLREQRQGRSSYSR